MLKEKTFGSVKRFGARYGRKPKLKFSKIEAEQRRFHKCPYCGKMAVRRIAVGIWNCRKCKAKFTAQAYSIAKKARTKEPVPMEQEIVQEPQAPEDYMAGSGQEDDSNQEV